ncbi:NEK1 [Symbiodinium necroappetens]|uniref:NEK1 protein n=1 Tax=Symbiodinium necroappetens TaxID=1628268 RepID=A0A813C7K9_9DINO|nr:NEK1 [Symbiodinium necroappetens]
MIGKMARAIRAWFLCLCALSVQAQDDDFEWFRCDACSASFFKINRTLVQRFAGRTSVPSYEFLEIIDEVCDTMFTKNEFGVKQHEGKKYLFGPGIKDHIPGLGFGQMGMGDYDKRLAAFCKMFVEELGEEKLQQLYWDNRQLNHTQLCLEECLSSASGTGAQSRSPRKPRPAPRQKPLPAPKLDSPKEKNVASKKWEGRGTAEAMKLELGQVLPLLPQLKTSDLHRLGTAVLDELTKRARSAQKAERAEL